MTNSRQLRTSTLRCSLRAWTFLAVLLLAPTLMLTQSAQAQTFTVLHNFTGGDDGATPTAGLILDRGGRLYGTSSGAGASSGGSAFKLAEHRSAWVFYSLYDFLQFSGGYAPSSKLTVGPDGALYGTTEAGGAGAGYGTVFKLQPPPTACALVLCRWTETVLYSFAGGTDGAYPDRIIFDAAGNIYGTTLYGGSENCGSQGCGTVYELTSFGGGWIKNTLYSFTGGNDGSFPTGGVIFDAAGNLYGTAGFGRDGDGVVFELSRSNGSWTQTVLHSFSGADAHDPEGPLTADAMGDLFGVTRTGGPDNFGTVFELAHPGSWTFEMLYNPTNYSGGAVLNGGLVFDSAGSLYGTTAGGGAYRNGTVFKLTSLNGTWTGSDLHDFTDSDGINPNGGLIFDSQGNLYGTAQAGGNSSGVCSAGCGTVWEFTP